MVGAPQRLKKMPAKVAITKEKLAFMNYLRRNVKGWKGMTLWYLGIRMPFDAGLQDTEYGVKSRQDFFRLFHAAREQYLYSILQAKFSFFEEGREGELSFFRFPFSESDVRIFFWEKMRRETILAIYSQFLAEQYALLNVRDRDVLDVGASCGDTPIYFALKGARRVIALEPFPAVCELAKRAINASALQKITLLNEGAGKAGIVSLDSSLLTDPSTSIQATDGDIPVRLNSLHELVKRFDLNGAALKADCEGCEYDLINDAPDETLRHFSEIVLEFERPPELYKKRLEKAGFKVRVFKNTSQFVRNSPVPGLPVGLVYAKL